MADSHLRETLPPLVTATFNLIPPLIAGVVMIQNRLLGLYYTTLHNYCQDYNFPSPPPPMESVVSAWSSDYEPVKREVESITCIATGKAVRQPMKLPDEPNSEDTDDRKPSNASTASSMVENGFRRSTSGLISNGNGNGNSGPPPPGPRPNRIPSSTSIASSVASNGLKSRPSFGGNLAPTDFTTASRLGQGQMLTPTPAISPGSTHPRPDYFGRPSTASTTASSASFNTAASALSIGAKKKPPPPPPKKISSNRPAEYVVARYPFSSQNAGDLSFREGDRIKIVKKTGTDQDWWVGELDGVKGSFPANYCGPA